MLPLLVQDAGHVVVLIYSVPTPDQDGKNLLFKQANLIKKDIMPTILAQTDEWQKLEVIDKELDIKDRKNLIKIYPRKLLCQDENHKCKIVTSDGPLYNSGRHFSIFGARLVVNEIFKRLNEQKALP